MQEVETELMRTARELGGLPVKTSGRLRRVGMSDVRRAGSRLASEYRRQYKLAVNDMERPLYGDIFVNEFYSIEKQLRLAADAFDGLRENSLPRLVSGRWMLRPRVYALASELVRLRGGVVDVNSVTAFFSEYQHKSPLTAMETGLIQPMLRLALLEGMCECLPGRSRENDGKISEHEDAECMMKLRGMLQSLVRLSDTDMDEAVRALNMTDETLAADAAYKAMDTVCRARYLDAAARIGRYCAVPETVVASEAVKLASAGKGRRGHVGCYLTAEGRAELISALRPDKHTKKLGKDERTVVFILTQLLLAAVLLIPFAFEGAASALLALLPVSSAAATILTVILTSLIKPKPLPRLSLEFGVGSENRTVVCVPVLITSEASVESAVSNLEAHYLSGRTDNTEYIVLGDFPDSERPEKEGEEELIRLAERRIAALNASHSRDGEKLFHYLHRRRTLHPADGIYMGRERKRGAIEDLISYITTGNDAPFICNTPRLGRDFRYMAVLDADTVMPAGALKKLIGTAAHPLNTPVFGRGKRPVYGYSVIVPRMTSTSRSAAASRFAGLVSGEPGMSAYSMCASDLYQDAFSEGSFGGKGLIDIRAFARTMKGAIPENTVLSHDMLEGCIAGAGFASDIVLYDGEPSTFAAWHKRRHRWLRGDFQLMPFLLGKNGRGLNLLSKYKIFDNLRRGASDTVIFAALAAGFIFGMPVLALGMLAVFFIDPLICGVSTVIRAFNGKAALKPFVVSVKRRLFEFAALPYTACHDADAVIRSCYRMAVSHRRMLEWQTSAAGAGGKMRFADYARLLFPCLAAGAASIAVSALCFAGILNGLGAAALTAGVFWTASPAAVWFADKKPAGRRFTDDERRDLMQLFGCTWQYFDENCTESTFFLPPDNYQERPYKGIAPLTSPTNIGMGLMAVVSAHDMGFIDEKGMLLRLEQTVSTIERLEKWHGHLFNWYSLKDLSLLKPRFISSVDSGNLFASLLETASALNELKDNAQAHGSAFRDADVIAENAGRLAARCAALAANMDFGVLYDRQKKLFRIGYEFEEGRLTASSYDLYASEARLMSFAVIADGRVGAEHWFSLSRLMSDASGGRVLKSWSGTMFEYLMPLIFMETIPHSMQYEVCRSAVLTQVLSSDGTRPWGVSESGCYAFDKSLHYQYRAFGEPELGLAPCRESSGVTAPYASALALMVEPKLAVENLRKLRDMGAVGKYGMYEALDYTVPRADGRPYETVCSFMAHHQGMTLCAVNNALNDNILVKRFMRLPGVRANEQLLFENMPVNPIKINTYDSSIFRERRDSRVEADVRMLDINKPADGQLLSNGRYSVFIGADGAGFSKCGGIMLTRWRSGARGDRGIRFVVDCGGRTEYADRCGGGRTAAAEPHKLVFDSKTGALHTRLSVMVSADFDCEIRELTLVNCGNETLTAEVGVFAEIALAAAEADEAHPAFVRLGIDASREDDTVLFRSRPGPDRAERIGFMCVIAADRTEYCTDGLVLPGRHTSCAEAMRARPSELPTEQPVEPFFSARTAMRLPQGESRRLTLIAGIASGRDEALRVIKEQRLRLDGAEELARAQARGMLRVHGIDAVMSADAALIAAAIAEDVPLRPAPEPSDIKLRGIGHLWRLGISGDRAIVLTEISERAQLGGLRKMADMLCFIGEKGVDADFVVIGKYPHEYANPLRIEIENILRGMPRAVLLHAFGLSEDDAAFLYANALVVLDAGGRRMLCGSSVYGEKPKAGANSDTRGYASPEAVRSEHRARLAPMRTMPLPKRRLFDFNGIGGFDTERGEYVIYVGAGKNTPLPWSSVLANESFGTLVTESGGGYTWRHNARLNRVTPWTNDAVRDEKTERLWMTDGAKRKYLSLLPDGKGEYEVCHGFSYSTFSCITADNECCSVTVCVDGSLPIKYYRVSIENTGTVPLRRIVTLEVDWALGAAVRRESLASRAGHGRAAAVNLLSEYGDMGFIALGPGTEPEASGPNFVSCRLDVGPGALAEAVIMLGCDKAELVDDDIRRSSFERAFAENAELDRRRLGALTVKTEDGRFDVLVNGRLLNQVYNSRLLGRTGFYQSGGAFGFRDQLQDVLALLMTEPERARKQILYCASMQFEAGDVLHWWHESPESDGTVRGVRTHISDDRLFLPYAAAEYIDITGDAEILNEVRPYLKDVPIEEGRKDVYADMCAGGAYGTLYEHCKRAIDISLTEGRHGLPLMGTGDWNDGMDCVGENGGESVFLGFFTRIVIEKFLPFCRAAGDDGAVERYESASERLRCNLEKYAWDGTRYVRAFHGDGHSLGGAESEECALDCVSECFAVFAGAEHKREAFEMLLSGLVDNENGLIKLLTPPFSGHGGRRVGYIESYIEGVRENGGQYTHAAAWSIIAACMLGRAETAQRLFRLINPVEHGNILTAERYKAEPYAAAGDVYSEGRLAGRAGWTLYTGAAGWLYRAAVEYILGIKKRGCRLSVRPCTPMAEFKAEYRFGREHSTLYRIEARASDREEISLDGVKGEDGHIMLVDDGMEHEVRVLYVQRRDADSA